ncbi:Xaa-Pro peptidase family protein [uncultured Arcticibacterium sp.]|uniref:M24 family metallopeptidase n=1 Tax=uncultured Arcticibacterium sp. TaxID=2173042 RepID=UPI0030F83FB3
MKRRNFLNTSALGAGVVFLSSCETGVGSDPTMDGLKSLVEDIQAITPEERAARVSKAQKLMQEQGISVLLLDAGTSLTYFTGISWWPSERPMVGLIPAKGSLAFICPGFEENRFREMVEESTKVYAWQEDESPYKLVAKAFTEMGISSGKVAIEERLRFFIYNGVKEAAPHLEYVSGDSVTVPCRIVKSISEILLMQKATEITTAAIKVGFKALKEGCTPATFSEAVAAAHTKMGAKHAFASCNFGEASAFPHGSGRPQILKKGDVVLVDCGCTVEGYNADISRTIVFGASPTARQQEIWDLEKKAQAAGFAAAQIGNKLHDVDAAARKVITDAGFGPDYQLPGLPHRTGHGIGMDGHEWGNAVKGNETVIEAGMCFSIEPTIAILGEFGVRLEDCVFISDDGPKWFSKPSPSILEPFD